MTASSAPPALAVRRSHGKSYYQTCGLDGKAHYAPMNWRLVDWPQAHRGPLSTVDGRQPILVNWISIGPLPCPGSASGPAAV